MLLLVAVCVSLTLWKKINPIQMQDSSVVETTVLDSQDIELGTPQTQTSPVNLRERRKPQLVL